MEIRRDLGIASRTCKWAKTWIDAKVGGDLEVELEPKPTGRYEHRWKQK